MLLHLAEQVAKQRKALEVELRSEQMRRNDREMSDDQWAVSDCMLIADCCCNDREMSDDQWAVSDCMLIADC